MNLITSVMLKVTLFYMELEKYPQCCPLITYPMKMITVGHLT